MVPQVLSFTSLTMNTNCIAYHKIIIKHYKLMVIPPLTLPLLKHNCIITP